MIVGFGSDLTDIRRIEQALNRFGDRFIARIFTETEKTRSERRAGRVGSYAKRFAAKEACAKALGTGMRRGVFWKDMGVVNARSGAPTMVLSGGAAARLAELIPAGHIANLHVSLSDEHPYAYAVVIIEATAGVPPGPVALAAPAV